jgi:protein-tyrosine-phosphatase
VKVLVLCTGNRWRSPLLAYAIRQLRPDWEVRSAGTKCSLPGAGVPGSWRRCVPGWNEPHAAQKVTDEMVEWADVVIGVQASHFQKHAKRMVIHRLVDPSFLPVSEWLQLAQEVQKAAQQIVDITLLLVLKGKNERCPRTRQDTKGN